MYEGICIVAKFTFQPSRTYAQYDLAALVLVPDIDETMTKEPASVNIKSMYPSVASRELATIRSDYARECQRIYRWVNDR
jgi:hypothetical protein